MAVPQKRKSKARSRSRRSANMKITPMILVHCPNCSAEIRSHRVCPKCGFYKGQTVMQVKFIK